MLTPPFMGQICNNDQLIRSGSSMSHEIRTPLNGIIGNLQFLLNSSLDDFQSDWTFGAHKAAEGMHALINDILDVSKAEAKMLKLFFDWFSVHSIVEDAVETLNFKAAQKGLELCYEVAANVPSSIEGDGGRIKQVLLNLIGNAIKFTQRGEISVKCDVMDPQKLSIQRPLDPNEMFLQFSVKDTGTGFAEEDKKLLFKPYSQIDNSNTRSNGGTGLGLILCKNMVKLHGGEIDAVGRPGEGSEFIFFARFVVREPDTQVSRAISSFSNDVQFSSLMDPDAQTASGHLSHGGAAGSPSSTIVLTGSERDSPALLSSASSDPSVGSLSYLRSLRPSVSSVKSIVDQADMGLTLPSLFGASIREFPENSHSSSTMIPTSCSQRAQSSSLAGNGLPKHEPASFKGLVYSILIVYPQYNTRRTTQDHIQRVLPKSVPTQITTSGDVVASQTMILHVPITFTHIVLQLSSDSQIPVFMDHVLESATHPPTCLIVVTDQAQKAVVTDRATAWNVDQLATENRLKFLLKTARPYKFANIFDPEQENAFSNDDHIRAEAHAKVSLQREAFRRFKDVLGDKGIRVLAVEDNAVNMQICLSYPNTERKVYANYI